nr:Gag-Asp_proteas domain-containing protein [Tanacetum cinerariifolium]
FICDGPHRARDCPKKTSLNGMSAHEDENASNGGSMGSMRILNAIKAKTKVPKVIGKCLQYVEATINGVKVRALVDFGTTTIDTWAGFVMDFKKQFYPKNAKNEAKSRFCKLKQSGTILEYVKEFTTLVLGVGG